MKSAVRLKSFFCLVLFFSFALTVCAQTAKPDPAYKLIQSGTPGDIVQSKNYYLLTLFEKTPAVKKLLEADPELSAIAGNKLSQLTGALQNCKEAFCYTAQMKFTDAEIATVSNRLFRLYSATNALGQLVKNQLIPSGTYFLYSYTAPDSLLVKAWEQDARGINFAIGVYAEGNKPNYPAIDSISFNVKAKSYGELVYDCAQDVQQECRNSKLFFSVALNSALRFIEMNERNNAADFEPMTATVNKAAYDRIPSINWNKYKYAVILVPGAGPGESGMAISAEGMLRCRVAALRYREGLAPFLVVSGGRVHPYKTKYCEALEMKKYLMEAMQVPENAIIVEPHARHTTTNMRNCVRLIFRYHMPFDKACITSTSKSQSYYIGALDSRCQKELMMVPYRQGKRLSDTELEFYPALEALQINPYEPMDP